MSQSSIPTPREFRMALNIKTADGGVARYSDVCEAWQEEVLTQMDPAWEAAGGLTDPPESIVPSKLYWELARGHAKSLMTAICALWMILYARNRNKDSTIVRGSVAAATKQQAAITRDKFIDLREVNPWLDERIDIQADCVVNRETGTQMDILPADGPSVLGRTDSWSILEEVAAWADAKGQALWGSLMSGHGKLTHSVFCVISNAGAGRECCWQWDRRETARLNDDWLFARTDGVVASWISDAKLEQLRRDLPGPLFDIYYGNNWSSTLGDVLYDSDILAAIRVADELTEREDGFVYVGGCDMALRRNHAACVVLGLRYNSGLARVAAIRVWRPQDFADGEIDYATVEADIAALHNRYHFNKISIDPSKADYLRQRLRGRGIVVQDVPTSSPTVQKRIADTVIERFVSGTVEIPNHATLVRDLKGLRLKLGGGGYRIEPVESRDGSHGDVAMALLYGLLICNRQSITVIDEQPKRPEAPRRYERFGQAACLVQYQRPQEGFLPAPYTARELVPIARRSR